MILKVRDMRFVWADSSCKMLTPKMAEGDGWTCEILESGTIFCTTSLEDEEGNNVYNYILRRDGLELLGYHPYDESSSKRLFILRKAWVIKRKHRIDGTITLLKASIDNDNIASFKPFALQEVFDIYGITRVKNINPNTIYTIYQSAQFTGEQLKQVLYTDGLVNFLLKAQTGIINDDNSLVIMRDVIVTGATWVIIKEGKDTNGVRREADEVEENIDKPQVVLYTLRNPIYLDFSELR